MRPSWSKAAFFTAKSREIAPRTNHHTLPTTPRIRGFCLVKM